MKNNLSNIKERILYLAENQEDSKQKFFKKIDMTYGNFTGEKKLRPINSDAIENILRNYPKTNPTWLLMGEGDMLLKRDEAHIVSEPAIPFGIANNKEAIPLVEMKAVAGFGNGNFQISERDVKDYYIVPKFKNKKIDFMIEVEGSSMYPKYNSGDVVACRIIREDRFIQWNKTHLVATKDQGLIIKRIKPSEKEYYLKMISDNKDYDPFEVHQDDLDGIALIVGVIRLE